MKLQFNKNFEYNLVNRHGWVYSPEKSSKFWKCYSLRNLKISVNLETKKVFGTYFSKYGIYTSAFGCKSLNDLYRLERLIEGDNNQQLNPFNPLKTTLTDNANEKMHF
jgi:hypothetical protein